MRPATACLPALCPKPLANQPGSGLHVNISLLRDGKNLFDGDFAPDSEAGHFVAGILAHARELTAFCNPVPNSYARAGRQRGPALRELEPPEPQPAGAAAQRPRRVLPRGLRGPDPAGNPYLVIGLILAAGLDGIQRKLPLPEAVNRNLFPPQLLPPVWKVCPHPAGGHHRSGPERLYQRRAARCAAEQVF